MIGLVFNGKHSYDDYGLILNYFQPQPPSPKKIFEPVPFMNGDGYDFSTVGSGDEIVYTGRDINCMFTLLGNSEENLYTQYGNILEWLLSGNSPLIHDSMPDVCFSAEVTDAPTFSKENDSAELQFKFRAYPFKQGTSDEGSDQLWDTFNFETSYLQESEFNITGSQMITLINPGRSISPKVNCSSSMTVLNNGYTANFISGDNQDWRFKLKPGTNLITVTGTGTIAFIFRKEIL